MMKRMFDYERMFEGALLFTKMNLYSFRQTY
jgi:hypothetical protein